MMTATETHPAATGRVRSIIDAGARQAVGPLGSVDLSPPQFNLLYRLASLPHLHVLPHADIVALLYGEKQRKEWRLNQRGVWAIIGRLNVVLTAVGHGPAVKPCRGHGYRLVVDEALLLRQESSNSA